MTYAVGAWWGYTAAGNKQRLVLFVLVSTQRTDQTCTNWLLTWTSNWSFLHEYRRMNMMYCNNCDLPVPAINMDYAAEGTTIGYSQYQNRL